MTAAMDVAYLDLPYVAHVDRREMLLRVCLPCWEDSCHRCWRGACICACVDYQPLSAAAPCDGCGNPPRSVAHFVTCEPGVLDMIVRRLARAVGGPRTAEADAGAAELTEAA